MTRLRLFFVTPQKTGNGFARHPFVRAHRKVSRKGGGFACGSAKFPAAMIFESKVPKCLEDNRSHLLTMDRIGLIQQRTAELSGYFLATNHSTPLASYSG
jgi:hypothetical protein